MSFDILLSGASQIFIAHALTFRSTLALITSFLITILIGKSVINTLKKFQKDGQPIRANGPESHIQEKAGTPTMGGLIIILSTLIAVVLCGSFDNKYLILCTLSLLSFGVLGFFDDYKKLKHKSSGGIRAKPKFAIQFILALILVHCVVTMNAPYIKSSTYTSIVFPNLISGQSFIWDIGIFYYLFASLVIVGTSNAVNLTDGLDGLAALPVALSAFCFGVFAFVSGNLDLSVFYRTLYVEGSYEVLIFSFALIGSCIGFLWFNVKPAQIFMGDVGSLSLGAAIGLMAVITKREIALVIVGGLFVMETVSVIIQVTYFKITGGKRFFKMTPIHHHFEKKGWPESKVVVRFWILAFIFMILGLMII